jgi:SEC-C motif
MSTAPSTGPCSDEGKSIASKNATTTGLYAASDYILPEEQSLYADLEDAVISELSPQGMLECRLVEEILGAMWRLRRCRKLEGELAAQPTVQPDEPMQPESAHSKRQISIDRARNQATRLLHKNTAELRRVQTERHYRLEIAADGIDTAGLGACDLHTVLSHADRDVKNIERRPLAQLKLKLETLALESKLGSTIESPTPEITKRTPPPQPQKQPSCAETAPEIARGSPCPCNSGQKYKRCCGKNAPPLLQHLVHAA